MNAEQMVGLAREAAPVILGRVYHLRYPGHFIGVQQDRGRWFALAIPGARHLLEAHGAVLSAPLNAENTRSPYALARALLRSAIRYERDPLNAAVFVANLAERKRAAWSEADAASALLDALLPAEATA